MLLGCAFRIYNATVSTDSPNDNGYLNLVDDSFFYNFDYHKFEPKKYFRQLKEISDSFQECLMLNGIKKSNFEKCCGKKFVKINRRLSRKVMEIKMNFQNDFTYRLKTLCNDKLDVVCSKLVEDLNDSMIKNKDPIKALGDRIGTFNLSKDKLKFLNKIMKDTKKNYENYVLCEKTGEQMKERALERIRAFINKTGVDVDYDYMTHWAAGKNTEPELDHSESEVEDTAPKNFNESIIALKEQMEKTKFDKANGVENRYRALKQDIEDEKQANNTDNKVGLI